ncbi:hypothetical protein CXB51_000996 [Gossypium anomalum]|uniref:Uncharacterized protein n=1 Tax=Gossypium anomalum TaxID=47600 RepID=A0A8J6D947_9ROSI|nr:hypothetical protein CXB51_000996 [Gossypium anomalum]
MGWRIGNGSTVNIWNDSWILGPGNGNIDINSTTVDHLISSEHYTWKKDIVRAITDGEQTDHILHIPIANQMRQISWFGVWFARNRLVHDSVRQTVNELVGLFPGTYGKLRKLDLSRSSSTKSLGTDYGACTYLVIHVADAFITGARACEQVIRFAIDMGFCQSGAFLSKGRSSIPISKILGRGGINNGGKNSKSGLVALGTPDLEALIFTPNLATNLFSLFGMCTVDLSAGVI